MDDLWYPQKLSVQIDSTKHYPAAHFVYSDMDVIDPHGVIVQNGFLSANSGRHKSGERWILVSLAFKGQPFPYPSTVLVKRELFCKSGGFRPLFRGNYHEDFELFARFTELTHIHFIPQSLVKYRQAPRTKISEIYSEENWPVLLKCLSELWRDDANRLKVVNYGTSSKIRVTEEASPKVGRLGQSSSMLSGGFPAAPFLLEEPPTLGVVLSPGRA